MSYRSSRKVLFIFLLVAILSIVSACGSATSGTKTSASSNGTADPTPTPTQSILRRLLLTPGVNRDCAAQVPVSAEDVSALLNETFSVFTDGYPAVPLGCELKGITTGRLVDIQFVRRDGNDTYWKQTVDGSKQIANLNQHQADYRDIVLPGVDAAFSLSYSNRGEVIFRKGFDICDVVVSTIDPQSPNNSPGTDQAKQLAQLFAERL